MHRTFLAPWVYLCSTSLIYKRKHLYNINCYFAGTIKKFTIFLIKTSSRNLKIGLCPSLDMHVLTKNWTTSVGINLLMDQIVIMTLHGQKSG